MLLTSLASDANVLCSIKVEEVEVWKSYVHTYKLQ